MIPATNFGTINTLNGQAGQTGTGTYMLISYSEHVGQSGQSRLQLSLADMTGTTIGFVWPEARHLINLPATPTPVSVTGTIQLFEGSAQLKVHGLIPRRPDEVQSASALLPISQCPTTAHDALARLYALEYELPDPLDGFLRQVLLDPLIGIPFLRCRASVNHHHAYPGGLLVHSTEMLNSAYSQIQQITPHDVWSPYLAQLAYLLHDLGKLKSVGETRRGTYGLVVGHEFLSIELLAPHLRWLELRRPELATALRYTLSHLATPYKARPIPKHVVAEVVATLDQWSAAAHNNRDLQHLLDGKQRGFRTPATANTLSGYSQNHENSMAQIAPAPVFH